MTTTIEVGVRARVATPATSANLGPGFDTLGLALDHLDECRAEVIDGPSCAEVSGEGAGRLPTDDRHLVIRAVTRGLADLDATVPGVRIIAHNTIPQARGLGSSSAAIVAGLALAWALARPGEPLDRGWLTRLGTEIEGHPDNVAAAAYGGLVIAIDDLPGEPAAGVRVVSAEVHPDIAAVAYVPDHPVSTDAVRRLLPASVPHGDAAANAGRAALLVHALARRPDLLLDATADLLHTGYRRTAMPASYELLTALRADGHAAVISGAGPTVLVLGTEDQLRLLTEVAGFARWPLRVGVGVRLLDA